MKESAPIKRALSDRIITGLKAASDGKPYDVYDTTTPGLAVRVMPSAAGQRPSKTFILIARYGGPRSHPARRSLGRVGQITTDQAREKARRWLALLAQGKDPGDEDRRATEAAERRRANTLGSVIEDYIDTEIPRQRAGKNVARELRRVIVPLWGKRPAADLRRAEVQSMIEAVRDKGAVAMLADHGIKIKRGYKRPTPTYARGLLSYLRSVYSWAIARDCYGLEASPCDHVSAERILGPRRQRSRILSADEIFAFWRAVTRRLPYPVGPGYQLLALAGLRLNEVFRAERSEFDLRGKVWIIPETRMKGRNGRARPHAVPLTDRMVAIIEALPANETPYLFTRGSKPHCLDDNEKADLDRRILRTLRALARQRGETPPTELTPWVSHDLRRTLRSALSQVRIDGRIRFHEDVKEAVLAHVKPSIHGVYDVYNLAPEKREALEHWDTHLMNIAAPPPRVVPLRRAG
jgi:integrase